MTDLTFTQRIRRKLSRYVPVQRSRLALQQGALSICFDDFPKNAWTTGGEILDSFSVRATYYVSGGLLRSSYRGIPHFDETDLLQVRSAGHEIGCHTFDHVNALQTPIAAFRQSIRKNQDFIETLLPGYRMHTFAYPFGDSSLSAQTATRQTFRASRSVLPAANADRIELSSLAAFGLESRQRNTYDLSRLVDVAAQNKQWLIFYTHEVSKNPSPYGCSPHDLELLLTLAKQAGLLIAPVLTILDLSSEQAEANV